MIQNFAIVLLFNNREKSRIQFLLLFFLTFSLTIHLFPRNDYKTPIVVLVIKIRRYSSLCKNIAFSNFF